MRTGSTTAALLRLCLRRDRLLSVFDLSDLPLLVATASGRTQPDLLKCWKAK